MFTVNTNLKNASGWVDFATIENSEALPSGYLVYTLPSPNGATVQYALDSSSHIIRVRYLGTANEDIVPLFHVLMWVTV